MILQTIQQHYPAALPSSIFAAKSLALVKEKYGLPPEQILLANSMCSDDVNNIEYPQEARAMLGPFNLGGLNGYPFTGITGMAAFAKHVPDEGAAMVFFAPHIGISEDGSVGKILRVGQHNTSSCCGAMVLALSRLQDGTIYQPNNAKNPLDYQQQTLEEIVVQEKEAILTAVNPIKEATEKVYEATANTINALVKNTVFTGKYIIVMGAIIINSDRQHGSFLALRKFDVLDANTKALLGSYTL
jgi:hypothetical protein